MRCLIIENDSTAGKLIQTYLSDYGECTIVNEGSEAIEIFEQSLDEGNGYDLVCLDVMIPGMDGYDILREIRSLEAARNITPRNAANVIVTSLLNDFESIANSFRSGCGYYIVKPVKKGELLEAMESLGLLNYSN